LGSTQRGDGAALLPRPILRRNGDIGDQPGNAGRQVFEGRRLAARVREVGCEPTLG
jgi:hypothetical protein